ncbi:MAG TPA: hypothetical protein VGO56_11715 [Pyrinomonadaceae bacterium]|jgi:hypothetical protein|nr:hypothetical protein [Pyrinomonadaceae bacterium]
MKGRYLKRIGGIVLAALMLSGVALVSAGTVEAQHRRQVIIVRPYRPFGRGFWGRPYGYPYGYNRYSEYTFSSTDSAANHGYEQGFKTGKDDGKKAKSFSYERSHYFQEAGFGNFGEVYRSAFSRGYQEGYRAGSNERAG